MAENDNLIKRFKEIDKNDIPDFNKCVKNLDMALWVLWVAKYKLGIKKLTSEQISLIIVETEELSIRPESIIKSLNRASNKVHRHYENDDELFEIMRPGNEYLLALEKKGMANAFYFEPNSRFSAKKILIQQVFHKLKGLVKIVDPYCGEKTLDLLQSMKGKKVYFLTRIENIKERERAKFKRDVADFKSENPNVELRNYVGADIHDRYVISEDALTIIGHSLKDLGAKETFAVVLNKENSKEIHECLNKNFDDRWKISAVI